MKVLITGASSGIGRELALQWSKQADTVFVCGRNEQRLEALCQQASNLVPLVFDVTDKQAVLATQEQIEQLDIVVINAGDCEYIDDPVQFDSDLFERIIKVNLISVGYCLEAWLNKMTPGSKLVLVGSSVTFVGLPRAEAYGASKAGIAYLADSLRLDLANHMIDVVLVEPGFVETPLTDRNHFDMPFIVSAKNAATRILTGVNKGKTTIRFPLRLMATLTLLSWLPWRWIHSMTIRK